MLQKVLESLLYHEQKYFSGSHYSEKVVKSSKICLMWVVYPRKPCLKIVVLALEIQDHNISYGSSQHILVNVLSMKRVAAKLVQK